MSARTRLGVACAVCLAGGVLSLILMAKHYGVPLLGEAVLAACGAAGGGCDIVAQSRYSAFLGVPLAAWGLFFYGSLLALLAPSLFGSEESGLDPAPHIGFLLVALAVGIDAVLLFLQAFVIKAFCTFCVATYVVNLSMLATLWPFRQIKLALSFLVTPHARRAMVAWIVATLGVGGAAIAGDLSLRGRKTQATESILGFPVAAATEAPTAEGSLEEQLAEARAEARKWKDTLDDEKRLQIYLNQKAKDDFNSAPVERLDLTHAPAQGAVRGPIAVVSYSDFMCPFCRDLASGLHGYLPASKGRVTSYYKHFPLDTSCNAHIGQSVHPGACELARGGICAEQSGRFWEYHDKVFAERWTRATREDVLRIGASVGLDRAALGACVDSAATRGKLSADIDEGSRLGVASTPTMFVNGRKLKSTALFLLAVEEERKRLNLSDAGEASSP